MSFKKYFLLQEATKKQILQWIEDALEDLTEAIKSPRGSFKNVLSVELSKFKSIDKFYKQDNKIAIQGTLQSGEKATKQVPFPDQDLQVRKDILQALNLRVKPKFK